MRHSILILLALALTVPQSFAACPAFPDGPKSNYVENGQQLMLCQQNELADATARAQVQAKFNGLETRFQQFEIQRRFDNLPSWSNYPLP